jgi:hypothetical protein
VITKAQRFRTRMAEKGLVQGNEWVPSNHRQHFKDIAKALREGQPVTIGKVPSNPKASTASADWLQPLADRAAFEERIKQTYDYHDLLGLAVRHWMKVDPADAVTTEEALDSLASAFCSELDQIANEAGFDRDEALDRLVNGVRDHQMSRDEDLQERDAQEPLAAVLEKVKEMVAKVEAAAPGPRKYAAFNGCVNDCGQVHIGTSQIGIVDLALYRWRAIYQKEDIASGRMEKASKPMGAYLVAKAVLEHASN